MLCLFSALLSPNKIPARWHAEGKKRKRRGKGREIHAVAELPAEPREQIPGEAVAIQQDRPVAAPVDERDLRRRFWHCASQIGKHRLTRPATSLLDSDDA